MDNRPRQAQHGKWQAVSRSHDRRLTRRDPGRRTGSAACDRTMDNFSTEPSSHRPFDLPVIRPGRRSSRYIYDDEIDDELDVSNAPASLYANMTVVSVTKAAWRDKSPWLGSEGEPAPASSSGTFSRLVRTTVRRKPEKTHVDHPEPHSVTLNLHQFQTDAGDSLGEDPEGWARLTF